MPAPSVPRLCRHKAAGQGYATFNGREVYLGPWPPDQRKPPLAVRTAYEETLARWLANGRRLPEEAPSRPPVTLNDVALAYLKHAESFYRPSDKGRTGETGCIKDALRPLLARFGRLPAAEFGPKALKLVREDFLAQGWCRSYVNHQVRRVVRMVKWAVGEELVPAETWRGLQAVEGLRRGAPGVRESAPVRPVAEAHVEAALPFMPPPVKAMVELMRLTAMRPGEVTVLRAADLDRTGNVWFYRPAHHKCDHHEGRAGERVVAIGPRGQAVLQPWLTADLTAFVFSPRQAENQRRAEQRQKRKTRVQPSQADRRKKRPLRQPGERYCTNTLAGAIRRACEKANAAAVERARQEGQDVADDAVLVPCWSPNQLRHLAATAIRREFGLEAARACLGHTDAGTTLIYAQQDMDLATDVARKVG